MSKYKRSHSAMNTKAVIPAIHILDGKLDLGELSPCDDCPRDLNGMIEILSAFGEVLIFDKNAEQGDLKVNAEVIDSILDQLPCRLAGGFKTNERVYDWLDKGATQAIIEYDESNLGFLDGVPADRLTIALSLQSGDAEPLVMLAQGLQRPLAPVLAEAAYYAKRILIRFAGTPSALDRGAVEKVVAATGSAQRLTVEDAVFSADDIAWLDSLGVESVVRRPLIDGSITLGEAMGAPLVSDRPDGLFVTVVVGEDLACLGVCYSNQESLSVALKQRVGAYWSRSRGLWVKGLTSGATQKLIRIDLDCDRDAIRFVVRQGGVGFCHMEQSSCFGDDEGCIGALARTLESRRSTAPAGSYTKRLFDDGALLKSKLLEECEELLAAADKKEAAWETADVLYFAMTACVRHGVTLAEVQRNLARKALRVRRRPGNAKPPGWKPGDPSPDAPLA